MAILLETLFETSPIGRWGADNVDGRSGDPGHTYWVDSLSPGGLRDVNVFANINTTFAREGTKSIRMGVIGDGTDQVYRSEISGGSSIVSSTALGITKGIPIGTERWIGFSMLFPSSNDCSSLSNNADNTTFFQYHTAFPGSVDSYGPTTGLALTEGCIRVEHAYVTEADPANDSKYWVQKSIPIGPARFDEWDDYVLRIKREYNQPGITEVYRGSAGIFRLVYRNLEEPNAIHHTAGVPVGGYFKFGLYLPTWRGGTGVPVNGSPTATRNIYIDSFRIGDANSSLVEVSPVGEPVNPPRSNRIIP